MQKNIFGKGLVIGIIILFVGVSGITSIGAYNISINKIITFNSNQAEPLLEGASYIILLK